MKIEQRLKQLENQKQVTGEQKLHPRIVEDGEDCDVRKPSCPPRDQYPQCTLNKDCWSRLAGNEIMYIGLNNQEW